MGFLAGLPASKAVLAGQVLGIASQFHEFYECFQRCDDTAMYIEKFMYILGYIVFVCGFSTPFHAVLKRTERIIHHTMGASVKQFFGSSMESYVIQGPAGILGTFPLTKAWDVMKDGAKCIRFNECEKGFNRIIANVKVEACNVPIGPDGNPSHTDYNVCEEIFNGTPLILSTCLSATLYYFSSRFDMDDDDDIVVANYDVPGDPQTAIEKKNEPTNPKPIVSSDEKRTLEYRGVTPICKRCNSPYTCLCPGGTRLPATCEAPSNSDSRSDKDVGPAKALILAAGADFPPGSPWNMMCNVCRSPFKCSCEKPPKDNKGDNGGVKNSMKPGDSKGKGKATDGRKSRSSSPKETTSSKNKTCTKENETGAPKRGPGRPRRKPGSKTKKTGKKNDGCSKRVTRSVAKRIAKKKADKEKRKSGDKNKINNEESSIESESSSESKSDSDNDSSEGCCICESCEEKKAAKTQK